MKNSDFEEDFLDDDSFLEEDGLPEEVCGCEDDRDLLDDDA